MTTQQLETMLHAQPFRRFQMRLADGALVVVRHPEFVARSPSGRTCIVYEPNDHFRVIDLLLVTSLETINGATSGRRPRKHN